MNRDNLPVQFFEPMTDFELEAHIRSCGELMQASYEAGNREAAMNWMQAMQEGTRARSAARVAAMELDYFGECGRRDRAAILEAQLRA